MRTRPNDGNNNKSVLAYDLTFSAPKSVSILYGMADDEISRLARAAHDSAVRDALGYLEREACWTRRGRNGVHLLKGDGLIIAAFRHRSSRAGDPQLHTHAVVANGTIAGGRTTTLDGRALYAHAKTASYLYQASLRHQLTERLGVEWSPVDKGIAEINGIDEPIRRHFSRRRAEILAGMRERDGRSAHAAQIATLETDGPRTTTCPSPASATNGAPAPLSSGSTENEWPRSSATDSLDRLSTRSPSPNRSLDRPT